MSAPEPLHLRLQLVAERSGTLTEVADRLAQTAEQLRVLEADGWRLAFEVDNGNMVLERPES